MHVRIEYRVKTLNILALAKQTEDGFFFNNHGTTIFPAHLTRHLMNKKKSRSPFMNKKKSIFIFYSYF